MRDEQPGSGIGQHEAEPIDAKNRMCPAAPPKPAVPLESASGSTMKSAVSTIAVTSRIHSMTEEW